MAILTWKGEPAKHPGKDWDAKIVVGKDPRVEIRKTFEGVEKGKGHGGRDLHHHAQVLIVVQKSGIVMSTNGRIAMEMRDFTRLHQAVTEAKAELDGGA